MSNVNVNVVFCPSFTSIDYVSSIVSDNDISVGAQNVSEYSPGAYTGEISIKMLEDLKCKYCIVGHSERRQNLNETNEIIINNETIEKARLSVERMAKVGR